MKNVLLKNFRQTLKQEWPLKMSESVYQEVIKKLIAAKIASPRLEARLLIACAIGTDADTVNDATVLTESSLAVLQRLVQARINHKPLDKVIGRKSFYKYDFIVNENVLSPRPDTEILIEAAAEIIQKDNLHSVLDLGVGSGCILLSLLKDFPQLRGTGIDKSGTALKTTRQNQAALSVPDKQINLVQTDWFDDYILTLSSAPFELIVSNPPYIPSADIATLEPEVKDFDPQTALDGGQDGLVSYRRLADICPLLLTNNGYVMLECGIRQAKSVQEIFGKRGFTHIETRRDLNNIDRCIIFRKKDCN